MAARKCSGRKNALALNLFGDSSQSPRVVIITHDCDLANEGEDIVEVIVGMQVPTSDPMLVGSRNPRRLDLMFTNDSSNQEPVYIRLCHSGRRNVPRKELLKFQQGNIRLTLPDKEKRILKQWLSARYGRTASPDNFESRRFVAEFFFKPGLLESQIAQGLVQLGEHSLTSRMKRACSSTCRPVSSNAGFRILRQRCLVLRKFFNCQPR